MGKPTAVVLLKGQLKRNFLPRKRTFYFTFKGLKVLKPKSGFLNGTECSRNPLQNRCFSDKLAKGWALPRTRNDIKMDHLRLHGHSSCGVSVVRWSMYKPEKACAHYKHILWARRISIVWNHSTANKRPQTGTNLFSASAFAFWSPTWDHAAIQLLRKLWFIAGIATADTDFCLVLAKLGNELTRMSRDRNRTAIYHTTLVGCHTSDRHAACAFLPSAHFVPTATQHFDMVFTPKNS